MKLEFYLKSNKLIEAEDFSEQMAAIYHRDEKKLEFEIADRYCVGKIPIFFESAEYEEIEGPISQDVLGCIDRISNNLEDIHAVLLCSYNDFLDILKWQGNDEVMNVGSWVTGVRGLIVYGTIGEDNSTLLISYGVSDS